MDNIMMSEIPDVMSREDFIAHHGILGQRWGVRRYQNSDGSLTAAGRARYNKKHPEIKFNEPEGSLKEESKLIASKNSQMVLDLSYYFSHKELKDIQKTLDTKKKISEINEYNSMAGKRKVDNLVAKGESMAKAYNFAARINNAFNKKQELPVIDLTTVSKSAKERAKDAAKNTLNQAQQQTQQIKKDQKNVNKAANQKKAAHNANKEKLDKVNAQIKDERANMLKLANAGKTKEYQASVDRFDKLVKQKYALEHPDKK